MYIRTQAQALGMNLDGFRRWNLLKILKMCEAYLGKNIRYLNPVFGWFMLIWLIIFNYLSSWLLSVFLISSLPLLHLYISQCKFHVYISFKDHHPLVQHVLLQTTGSSTYEINYWSVHTYIWVCFIQMYPIFNIQDHHPLVQHVLLQTTGSSTYEINYWSVHTYIWVCFIQMYPIFNMVSE